MRILAIGDVVGSKSVDYLSDRLFRVKRELGVDFTVANGENASEIHGIAPKEAENLFSAGVDVITLGNHAFGRREIYEMLDGNTRIIRPANYPRTAHGTGHTVVGCLGKRILCINVQGTALMEPLACPFESVERILERERGKYDVSILDVHAEATSEKLAIAHCFDGRISIIFGTHTHVPTADEQILPRGTGYITDIGMTGPVDSVIGTDKYDVIEKFRTRMPTRFKVAAGDIKACGAIFDVDIDTGRVTSVRRVRF